MLINTFQQNEQIVSVLRTMRFVCGKGAEMKHYSEVIPDEASIVICSQQETTELLALFEQRFTTSNNWRIEEVEIDKIIPLCRYVYSKRLEYTYWSINECTNNNIPAFYPHFVCYSDGRKHLIVPPIIENRKELYYLGDGMHRVYTLKRNGFSKMFALLTDNCILPLAGKPQNWNNVVESSVQYPCEDNFEEFCKDGFTGYSKFCNSDLFWKHGEYNL